MNVNVRERNVVVVATAAADAPFFLVCAKVVRDAGIDVDVDTDADEDED